MTLYCCGIAYRPANSGVNTDEYALLLLDASMDSLPTGRNKKKASETKR